MAVEGDTFGSHSEHSALTSPRGSGIQQSYPASWELLLLASGLQDPCLQFQEKIHLKLVNRKWNGAEALVLGERLCSLHQTPKSACSGSLPPWGPAAGDCTGSSSGPVGHAASAAQTVTAVSLGPCVLRRAAGVMTGNKTNYHKGRQYFSQRALWNFPF